MALQSQTSRSTGWSSSSSNNPLRGAPAGTKLLVAGAGLAAVAVGVLIWSRSGGNVSVRETGAPGAESSIGSLVYSPAPAGGSPTVSPNAGVLPRDPLSPPTPTPSTSSVAPSTNVATRPMSEVAAPVTPREPDRAVTPTAPTSVPAPAITTPSPTPASPAPSEPTAPIVPAPDAAPQGVNPAVPGAPSAITAANSVAQAQRAITAGNLLEARTILNNVLWDTSLAKNDRAAIRAQLAALNDKLFFSPMVVKNDTLTDTYAVQSGDVLVRLPIKQSWPVDYRFIQRINGLPNANSLRVGQRLKAVRMPVHAVVHKKDYRMDLYAGPPISATPGKTGPDGQEEGWVYLRSVQVGLGESNGTPEGLFVVRPKSKLVNPRWVNPRTGEVFDADNPKNPIGEYWVGLDGADENTRRFTGYGIHGTIDADSVGRQMSMGCVRLNAEDVKLVWELLIDGVSAVKIIE